MLAGRSAVDISGDCVRLYDFIILRTYIYVQLEVLENYQSFSVEFWLEYFALKICKN